MVWYGMIWYGSAQMESSTFCPSAMWRKNSTG